MAVQPDTQQTELFEEIAAVARERMGGRDLEAALAFIALYYAGASPEDLTERLPDDLYGAAVAHLNLARRRAPGEAKVRVYNPEIEQHGWQSTHTIVEIVTDDMPFLVDSVRMVLNGRGHTSHLVIHPVMRVRRGENGDLAAILAMEDPDGEGTAVEALIHIETDRQTEQAALDSIAAEMLSVLGDVRAAVEDWGAMRGRMRASIEELDALPPLAGCGETGEVKAFLEWIEDNHFTFLGYCSSRVDRACGAARLVPEPKTGLGLLRGGNAAAAQPIPDPDGGQPAELLAITRADTRSRVHRPSHLDCIAVRRFDADGNVAGEHRFLGLYTSEAFNRVPLDIPLLRQKAEDLQRRAGYPPNSHAAKALQNIVDTFPRELLFQIPAEELFETATGILHLQERQRIRLFVHPDRFGRFYSCIVFVPRDRFTTRSRLVIQGILEEAFGATDTEFTVRLSESVLARLFFVMRVDAGHAPQYDLADLESRLRVVSRTWTDDLRDALLDRFGEERGTSLFRRYGEAFRADYRETYAARVAVPDVEKMERIRESGIEMSLYRPLEAEEGRLRFKLFQLGQRPVALSDVLPMLENMGLKVEDEHPSKIKRTDAPRVWLHDFGLLHGEGPEFDPDRIDGIFRDAFARIWSGEVENDGFNRLVLRAGIGWREIVVLRAYCKYLRQAGTAFSEAYIQDALAANPGIVRMLVELFGVRLDPAWRDGLPEAQEEGVARLDASLAVMARIEAALEEVANLDEDRILRSYLGVIGATLRTNFFQAGADGGPKPYLSFKLDPHRIPELPEPRPKFEIFVYSPRVEAVHLRGGAVARGGIRWSDRREDFRTEVLGLAKAQTVKNAVIVPVGSKGGFVPKKPPLAAGRDAVQEEGIACYRTFVRGMLDITDNLAGGQVVPPAQVVRHDGDDPYLVVAADKGTATFSDIANELAREYGFWLGDAFASGGSQGYDHKGMGITARGGWESVKRHFRELGIDCQSTGFTAVGIGDMGGDVFGNAMLLSRHIRLVAAFNHMHIFIDPDPDAEAAFAERRRLFALPRSTWDDFDRGVLSAGGGIYPRSAKSVPLSAEAREALGTDAEAPTPNELIALILKAPVDLLWNGGIGTYVKSRRETHADVGDRANDAVRIDGEDLRCRVVGEGGNLGFTQLGRIEYAAKGGRVNTDAIDNSGGVDCSDHEVNIKVLLNEAVAAGDMTGKQRNRLLEEMTGEVADLVLRNNYLQTQALSVAASQAPSMLEVHGRLIRRLERDGELDREIEFLPGPDELAERLEAKGRLFTPELAVLNAYVKIGLFQRLLASALPDEPFAANELRAYFPPALGARFGGPMPSHRLAREIVATQVANEMVNRCGMTFAFRLGEETGADDADIARAYLVAREVYGMGETWRAIEALDGRLGADVQISLLQETRKLVERAARWLLRNRPRPLDIARDIEHFAAGATALRQSLRDVVAVSSRSAIDKAAARLAAEGVPEELALEVASCNDLLSALAVVEVAAGAAIPVETAASVYFDLGEKLDLHWLRDRIAALPRGNRWQALSRAALRDDLYAQLSALTLDALRLDAGRAAPAGRVDLWLRRNRIPVARCRQIVGDLMNAGRTDFTMLSVAMGEVRTLRQSE
ncbi:MAG: NAD-glutamate dehydrogenase [Alphaproteobacteria bacterium]|nr:NAD-glutamate dehydrogenase [Alphaproteobacteria bacterium]